MNNLRISLIALLAPLVLAACAGVSNPLSPTGDKADGKTPMQASFSRFPDMPMPVKADLDMGDTLIFGTNDAWIGRLVVKSPHSSNDMFDFYKQEMPGFDWQEITSIRSSTSVMTYTRGERVATIQIKSSTLKGAIVTITVSPRGAQEFPAPTDTGAPPAAK